jgi:hypothetical protein
VAQRYVVESQAQALRQQPDLPAPMRQALFEDTVSRYESLRRGMADDPDLSADEAGLWLDEAPVNGVEKARSLLKDALHHDPRHVESLQLLAQTYFRTGHPAQGYAVLQDGMQHALFERDRLVLFAESLIQGRPAQASTLREIQQNLKNLQANCLAAGCAEKNRLVTQKAAEMLTSINAQPAHH